MDENTGGAGPALAAHSEDASAYGQTPASLTVAKPKAAKSRGDGEPVVRMFRQLVDLVRLQPLGSMAVSLTVGVMVSKMLGRR